MIQAMPKSIVVGIANVDRRRDFTYATTIAQDKKDFPTTGGSAKFIGFIEKELQPYIQNKYKVNTRTVIGQSLGGLLATEVLLKKPYLFDNYLLVSPSLWWDNESLLNAKPTLLEKEGDRAHRILISIGKEGRQMEDDVKRLVQTLNAPEKKNLKIDFMPLPEETHLTILHNSVYKAFQLLYGNKEDQKKQ
jgi:predicted alpha/beta superfamily hydrolase